LDKKKRILCRNCKLNKFRGILDIMYANESDESDEEVKKKIKSK